jgi:hypothetical protein
MENFLFGGGDFGVVVYFLGGFRKASLMARWLKDSYLKGRHLRAISLLQKGFAKDDKGEPTFRGNTFDDARKLLLDDFICNLEIPIDVRPTLISKAVWACAAKADVSENCLIVELTEQEKQYLSRPKISYRLLSSVSISGTIGKKPRKWMGSVSFNSAGKFLVARGAIEDVIRQHTICETPFGYQPVITVVKAREECEAFESALRKFNLVRAVWNLYYNRQFNWQDTMGVPSALNKIVAAPTHTLHGANGELLTETFNYDTSYVRPVRSHNWSREYAHIEKFFDKVQRKLSIHPMRTLIEDSLVDYVLALDSSEHDVCFLRLWKTLEMLVGSIDPVESKKQTIKRASSMFADHEYAESVLSRLLERRNELVHGRKEFAEMERSMHYVRQFVEQSIGFFLDNKFSLRRHEDFLDFLSLPRDVDWLKRQTRLLLKAKGRLAPRQGRKRITQSSKTSAA